MPVTEKNKKVIHAARSFKPVMLSDSKEIPTRIEIMQAGEWPDDSNKGHLVITIADLHDFKNNFDKGVGMPGGPGFGLPVDFAHEDWNRAAGWMQELEGEGDKLYANQEWSGDRN